MKNIKILGSGCPRCKQLENNAKIAVEKAWIDANVEKITDMAEIMAYDVMSTPVLVIDEKIVSQWKIPEVDEIIDLMK